MIEVSDDHRVALAEYLTVCHEGEGRKVPNNLESKEVLGSKTVSAIGTYSISAKERHSFNI
jgi:hypothetical protein